MHFIPFCVSLQLSFLSSVKKCYITERCLTGGGRPHSSPAGALPKGEAVHHRQSRLTSLAKQAKSNLNDSPSTYGNHYLIPQLAMRW